MIVILGESGSGKSTLQRKLIESDENFKKVVTYTTRPIRPGEVDGVDYHFISEEQYKKMLDNQEFIEYASYNDWNYGTAKEDCLNDFAVAVLTPAGWRALRRAGINTTSIYLWVDRRTRLINLLCRGDNIEEAYRRNLSDVGQFDGIEHEVDYVISNQKLELNPDDLLEILMQILNVPEIDEQMRIENENS